ncbi:MAG: hypothetical protein A2Y33_04960 [Spirochaetes bacterium GWF1_51_8]|nr:MAG: hypothetical protein A2Y33_04960 [Spirochaetes bacterium GWF1_51_8]
MKNGVLLFLAALLFAFPLLSHSIIVTMDRFPYKKYIFRMMKIPYEEWEKMSIAKETVRELEFTYDGTTYNCLSLKCGEIYVSASDGKNMIYTLPIKLFKYKTMTIALPNEHKW